MLAEERWTFGKCTTTDLMSDEEDGGVSRWIAAVEIRGNTEVHCNAPQTSAKWTELRQNATSYLQLRGGKQTLHG